MPDFSSISIPKPLNWQDFERNCRVLFECILGDPNTQLNGRGGQPQNGVDIYGRRGGKGTHWVGVQCKGKADDYHGSITEAELRREAGKARNFVPVLSEFIIATTAPDDQKIQEAARKITHENEIASNPMTLAVWGWSTLQDCISQHHAAIKVFHPDYTPFTDKIIGDISGVKADTEIIKTDNAQMLAILKDVQTVVRNASDNSTKEIEVIDQYLHSEIDGYRDLVRSGQPRTALGLLEKLKERCVDKASNRVRFRIITNIGAAKLKLGDEKGAAADFLTATEYDPTDRVGMANVALAHMIMGRRAEAIAAGEAALQRDPANEDAACYLIQCHFDDSSIIDPLSLVSQELRNTQAVRMGSISFFRRRRHRDWRKAALDAVRLFPEADEIKRAGAEANLDSILEARWFLLGECSPVENATEKLKDAASVLQSIWDDFRAGEMPLIETGVPHNLAIAYRALGKYDLAARVLDEALAQKPDAVNLVKLRVVIHLASNEDEKALSLLQEKELRDPASAIMKAELLLMRNPAMARETVSDIDVPGIDEEHRLTASLLTIQSYLLENQEDLAHKHANNLVNSYPQRIEPLTVLFRVQGHFGDSKADETLGQALKMLDSETSFHDRFVIAQALNKRESYDEVIEVLDGRVDFSRDTPALQLFLPALINSDRRKQAHEIIKALPQEVADKPFYLRIQAWIHMVRGDYSASEQAIERYLQAHPNDLSMRLKWIDLRIRRGSETDAKTFLVGNVEQLEGNSSERMYLAVMLGHFGFSERALRLAYEVFLKNRRDPLIHLQYMGLLLSPSRTNDVNLEITEVMPDAVFIIENDKGEQDTYCVEKEEQLRVDEKYIAPDHPIAEKAGGLKVNEKFIIHDEKQPIDEWRIASIKHKYLDALHKSMEHFERQFPTVTGFERVMIEQEGPVSLQPILTRVKKRHEATEAALDQYEQNRLPLELLTHSFGGNVIQIWHGLISSGRNFRVCIGIAMEREAALQAIAENESRGCVVDTLTFYIMRRLGIEDAVSAICGPIGITETAVDVFRFRREEICSHMGNPFMTVFWRDGQYFREEVTDEQLRCTLSEVDDDLSWIKEHCEILPAEGTHDLSSALRELSSKLGRGFFDSILAADGAGRLLLCEDFAYRMIGTQQSGLRTAWLQPVLMIARQQNLLTIEKYCEAVINMTKCRTHFISIDAQVLLTSAQDENDEDGRKFAKIVETLGAPDVDIESSIRVAANFFNIIWGGREPTLRHKAQTGKIIECLMRGRGGIYRDIAGALSSMVFSPNKRFQKYLLGWLEGHFFIRLSG